MKAMSEKPLSPDLMLPIAPRLNLYENEFILEEYSPYTLWVDVLMFESPPPSEFTRLF